MNKRALYLSLLVLSIITASSLYLSWSADTGLGGLIVERMEIESDAGRPVKAEVVFIFFDVYFEFFIIWIVDG